MPACFQDGVLAWGGAGPGLKRQDLGGGGDSGESLLRVLRFYVNFKFIIELFNLQPLYIKDCDRTFLT
jgi:hypothetical protein